MSALRDSSWSRKWGQLAGSLAGADRLGGGERDPDRALLALLIGRCLRGGGKISDYLLKLTRAISEVRPPGLLGQISTRLAQNKAFGEAVWPGLRLSSVEGW